MKYNPHNYQKYSIEFIKEHKLAALLLECGLGKTSVTLSAINDLMNSGEIHKVLVIAPLRVVNVWKQETEKWDELNDLTVSKVVGSSKEREKALSINADIYVINRENVEWLVYKSGFEFDFDMVVIDELSSFKSYSFGFILPIFISELYLNILYISSP